VSRGLEATTRLATRAAAVSVLVIAVGCGAPRPKNAQGGGSPPAPSVASASAPASAPVEPLQPASGIRVEAEARGAPPGPRPRLEILSPTFGEVLPELAVHKHEVRVQATPPLAPGWTLAASLDGLRPRAIEPAAPLVLGDLIAEDLPLTRGAHSLLLVVLDAAGNEVFGGAAPAEQVFALVDFYVGARDRALPPPTAPRLFCLGPVGTFHGDTAESPLLELFAIGPHAAQVPLRIEAGSRVLDARVDPRARYRLLGLPAGDVRISAGSDGGPRAECLLTLNPEQKGGS